MHRPCQRPTTTVLAVVATGALLLVVGVSLDRIAPTAPAAAGQEPSRDFTIAGPPVTRGELVLDGSAGLLPGAVDDGEDAFDAMLDEFEAGSPGLIRFGGRSVDGSGVRFVLVPEPPSEEQIEVLEGYGLPLRVEFGTAPTPRAMSTFAQDVRAATLDGSRITFQGYGYNADHTGVEILYSAPATLSAGEIQVEAGALVDAALGGTGARPAFDVDFLHSESGHTEAE